jgi:hypothetical protein
MSGRYATMRVTKPITTIVLAVLAATLVVSACSDDARDKIGDAANSVREDVESKSEEVRARTAAEAFRASIKADDLNDARGGARELALLHESAEDLPGDSVAGGIDDGDGDGVDDDGFVEFVVGDAAVCVTLPATGDDIDVSGGRCV